MWSKKYTGRHVGDCPEAMPLDNLLFQDVRCFYNLHVTFTSMIPCTDPHRFSKDTPNLIGSATAQLWKPNKGVAVGSNRIIQGILQLKEENFFFIVQDGGRVYLVSATVMDNIEKLLAMITGALNDIDW